MGVVVSLVASSLTLVSITPAAAAVAPTLSLVRPNAAALAGTAVVLEGSGFEAGARVLFGDTDAPWVRVEGADRLTAVTPDHAPGPVDVRVVTSGGTSNLISFTYLPGGWAPTAAMGAPRTAHTATVLEGDACAAATPAVCGQVLVVGGRSGADATARPAARAELYDPTDLDGQGSWTTLNPPRSCLPVAVTLEDGESTAGSTRWSSTSARFSPTDVGNAITGAHIPPGTTIAAVHGSSIATLSAAATATGANLSFTLSRVPPTCATGGHSASLLADGTVLVAGGTAGDATVVATAERYDPANGAWSDAGALAKARSGHTATVLEAAACHAAAAAPSWCGLVLVVGGVDGAGRPQPGPELFSPGTGWRPVAVEPATARVRHTATPLGDGRVLVVGGDGNDGNGALASALIYHPDSDTWAPAGSLDACGPPSCVGRSSHTATALGGGAVLVAGGTTGVSTTALASAQVYRPGTGTAAGTWASTGSMTDTRVGHTATALASGAVLVAGGSKVVGSPPLFETEVYDRATARWAPAGAMGGARAGHAAAALPDATVVVTGGTARAEGLLPPPTVGSAERFDPSRAAPPPSAGESIDPAAGPPGGGTAVTISGSGLFPATVRFAGTPATVTFNSLSEVTVVSPPHVPGDVEVTVTTPVGNVVVTFTYGESSWTETAPLTSPGCPPRPCVGRYFHTATPLANGEVLVAGGVSGHEETGSRAVLTSAERFVPENGGRWQPTGPLISARAQHTATTLDGPACRTASPPGYCGKVLVAGGNSAAGIPAPIATAELYDPVSGTWSATGSLHVARFDHTATLLRDGTVLVVGGGIDQLHRPSTDSVEIYDPDRGMWREAAPLDSCPPRRHTFADGATAAGSPQLTSDTARFTFADAGRPVTGSGIPAGTTIVAVTSAQSVTLSAAATATATGISFSLLRSAASCVGRTNHTATLLDGPACTHAASPPWCHKVLVAGGLGLDPDPAAQREDALIPLRSAAIYDPEAATWVPAADLTVSRYSHTATVLAGAACEAGPPGACGRVLVAGGIHAFTGQGSGPVVFEASAELYDPSVDAWVPTGSINDRRGGHTATALASGEVLVVGRKVTIDNTVGGPLATAELYDPVSGRWRRTGPLHHARGTHTATVLGGPACADPAPPRWCGAVVVAGGATGPGGPYVQPSIAEAEIYTPEPTVSGIEPTRGPSAGGTTVTITGSGLAAATAVSFGGAAVPVTVVSPTAVTATTPSHPPGPVTVVVHGARPARQRPTFTYTTSGSPARVGDLAARATSGTDIELSFSAPPADDAVASPAERYVVKEAATAIVDDAGFNAAHSLCEGSCVFSVPAVGERLTIAVGDRSPGTTYHYAVRAVNEAGVAGPLSNPASATTPGAPDPAVVVPASLPTAGCVGVAGAVAPGRVAYPAGYSLVGLPAGSSLRLRSTLYGWFDQGAGGQYSALDASGAVEGGRGYWAWSPCPTVVDLVAGAGPATLTLPLGAYRASLVGNPSTGPVTVSGHDYAARWDASLNAGTGGYHLAAYREPQTLGVGEGIWVFSYRDTTIAIR